MNTSKEEAIEVAVKALKDIGYYSDDIEAPKARFDPGVNLIPGVNKWLVSFPVAAQDYGTDSDGISFARLHVSIRDEDKMALELSQPGGYIKLKYDTKDDKYLIAIQRP